MMMLRNPSHTIVSVPSGGLAFVQAKSSQSAGTGIVSAALTSNVTANNLLIAVCCNNTGTIPTVAKLSDTRGNTWLRAGNGIAHFGSNSIAIFYTIANGSGANTVTYNHGSDYPTIAVYEFSGNVTTSVLDVSAYNEGTDNTYETGTTGTTAQANELIIVAATHAGGTSTPTVTSPYILGSPGAGLETDSNNEPLGVAYKIVSATGTQTATFTWQSAGWSAGIATFKGA